MINLISVFCVYTKLETVSIEHGILKDILLKEKGVIEDMITVCYDEEIYKMREAEYNQELGEERGKEIGKLLQPETI